LMLICSSMWMLYFIFSQLFLSGCIRLVKSNCLLNKHVQQKYRGWKYSSVTRVLVPALHVFSYMWMIDPKDEHIHKKPTIIHIYTERVFIIVELFYGT
jgi:hypothetical protein